MQPINARGAIYLRCATTSQPDGFDLDTLGKQLREAASQDGSEIVKVYQDQGVSGLSQPAQRPGFSALLQDAREGKFNVLYVSSLDRFGRNLPVVLEVVSQLQIAGIKIKAGGEEIQKLEPGLLAIMAGPADPIEAV